jgi:hypothetical protein
MANREALEAVMNAVLTTKTTNDWIEVLELAGRLRVRPNQPYWRASRSSTGRNASMPALVFGSSQS